MNTNITAEALLVSIRAILRDRARMEKVIVTLEPTSQEATEMADDLLRIVRVLGELYDLYDDVLATNPNYPSFEELENSTE